MKYWIRSLYCDSPKQVWTIGPCDMRPDGRFTKLIARNASDVGNRMLFNTEADAMQRMRQLPTSLDYKDEVFPWITTHEGEIV